MSATILNALSGLTAKFATKTGVLAGVGVLSASGVAAAAAGAPIPVIEDAFDTENPSLVEVEEAAAPEEATDGEAVGDGEDAQDDAEQSDEGENGEVAAEPEADAGEEVGDEPEADAGEAAGDEGDPEGTEDAEGDEPDNHGKAVSSAAQTECGKKADGEASTGDDDGTGDEAAGADEDETSGAVEDSGGEPAVEEECGDTEWKNHGEYVSDTAHANRDAKADARATKEHPGKGKGKIEQSGDGADVEKADAVETDEVNKPGKGNAKGPKPNKVKKG